MEDGVSHVYDMKLQSEEASLAKRLETEGGAASPALSKEVMFTSGSRLG